jgi:ABC-type transporter Mla subunit MlaD
MRHRLAPVLITITAGLLAAACSTGSSAPNLAPERQACAQLVATSTALGKTIEQSGATSATLQSGITTATHQLHALTAQLPPAAAKKLKGTPSQLRALSQDASAGNGAAFAQDYAALHTSVITALQACTAAGV